MQVLFQSHGINGFGSYRSFQTQNRLKQERLSPVELGAGVITVTWRESRCVFGWWWAADLSGANSATVWVVMCQCGVLLGAGCVCVCVGENGKRYNFFLYTHTHLYLHTFRKQMYKDILSQLQQNGRITNWRCGVSCTVRIQIGCSTKLLLNCFFLELDPQKVIMKENHLGSVRLGQSRVWNETKLLLQPEVKPCMFGFCGMWPNHWSPDCSIFNLSLGIPSN